MVPCEEPAWHFCVSVNATRFMRVASTLSPDELIQKTPNTLNGSRNQAPRISQSRAGHGKKPAHRVCADGRRDLRDAILSAPARRETGQAGNTQSRAGIRSRASGEPVRLLQGTAERSKDQGDETNIAHVISPITGPRAGCRGVSN